MATLWLLLTMTPSRAATHYVNASSTSPVPPYSSWSTAAVTIQDAVDLSDAGDEVVVTNGVYATGGRVAYGSLLSRVAVTKAVTVRSVNGPQFTLIQGFQLPELVNGDGAVRCTYLTNGASLVGFTLTGGATRTQGNYLYENSGGGALCESSTAVVSNCVIVSNSAAQYGGGVAQGSIYNCTLQGNSGNSGGGAYECDLYHCTLAGNSAPGAGGGVYLDFSFGNLKTLNDCLVISNSASGQGGGGVFALTGAALNNCTVVGNSATYNGGGIMLTSGVVNNCIIYYNSAPNGSNWLCCPSARQLYCCTVPFGSITNEPLFLDLVGGNLRLQSNSPCINAGNNSYVVGGTDLDGNPRIINGTVDIGAYEFQGPSGTTGFHAWLAQYGLPTDGSADYIDSDGDGMNNWQEWRAGTNPTNAASVLRLLSASPSGTNVVVNWQSVLGIGYFLQSASNLSGPGAFITLATNLAGQSGVMSFADTNSPGAARLFYRVGAQ